MGKLAAGLAHELNNPASAGRQHPQPALRELLTERRKYALGLRTHVLSPQVHELMTSLGEILTECADTPWAIDPLERADREADLSDWLESVNVPGELASSLVDAGITAGQLQPLTTLVPSEILTLGARILVIDHEILCLTRELEEASRRISDLVKAVKSYSYMDQSPVAEIDVEQGIDTTLRMFQHKLKLGVQVSRNFSGALPRIRAERRRAESDLDQPHRQRHRRDAASPSGSRMLSVKTCTEPNGVLVEIGDNGPGIPAEVQGVSSNPSSPPGPLVKAPASASISFSASSAITREPSASNRFPAALSFKCAFRSIAVNYARCKIWLSYFK